MTIADAIDVHQLWAQLVALYKRGEQPELEPAEQQVLTSLHTEHTVENPLETWVYKYFTVEPGNETLRCHTATIIERLQAFGVNLPADAKVAGRRLAEVLLPMGLANKPIRVDGILGKGYMGIAPNEKEPIERFVTSTGPTLPHPRG